MRAERNAHTGLVALLVVLAVVPYLNTLGAGFTLDDEPDILNNPVVTGGVDVIGVLSSSLFGILYRPLTILSFALNEALTPGNAAPFHAVNIVLHAGVTVLVFALGMQLFNSTRIAGIAAALFALHPVHTEAVTNIVGRAEVLAALFGLLALLSAVQADRAATRWGRAVLQWLSVASFALALLSKESAVMLVPLLVMLRITCRGEALRRGLWTELRSLDWVPYVLCIGVFAGVRGYVVAAAEPPYRLTPLDNVLGFVPWSIRVGSALGVVWDYFGLLNVPLVLAADYSYAQVPLVTSWASPRCLAGLALVGAAVLVYGRQRRPALGFAALFPVMALALTANVVFPIGTVKAERLLYLPSVGWVLVVAYGIDRLLREPRYRAVALGLLTLVMAVFGARTWTRNWDWTDNLTLYRSMARTAPDSAKARYNFGIALQKQGAHAAAIGQFQRALSLYPWAEGAALGIGYSLQKQGFSNQAIKWHEKALAIAPGLMEAHTDLCHAYLSDGRFEAAAVACRNGLRYAPTDANLLKGLGMSLIASGATEKGVDVLRRALALNGSDDELRIYLTQLQTAAAPRGTERTTLQ